MKAKLTITLLIVLMVLVAALFGVLIFLEQAEHNELLRLNPGDELYRIVKGISGRPRTEQAARAFAALADGILRRPVWLLKNRGDAASAQMALDAIRAEGSADE